MNDRIKITKAQAKPILAASFPDYRGRTIAVEFCDHVTYWDTNWGGGTRNQYCAVGVDPRGRVVSHHLVVGAPWDNPVEGKTVALPPDVLLVRHTIFCGKDLGVTVYAHPTHGPRWLTAGA